MFSHAYAIFLTEDTILFGLNRYSWALFWFIREGLAICLKAVVTNYKRKFLFLGTIKNVRDQHLIGLQILSFSRLIQCLK